MLKHKWSLYYSHTLKKWYCRCLFQFSPTFTRNLFERSYVYDHPKYKQIVRYFSLILLLESGMGKNRTHIFIIVFPFMFSKIEDGISKSRRKKNYRNLLQRQTFIQNLNRISIFSNLTKKTEGQFFSHKSPSLHVQQYYTKWYFPYMCAAILTAKLI